MAHLKSLELVNGEVSNSEVVNGGALDGEALNSKAVNAFGIQSLESKQTFIEMTTLRAWGDLNFRL